MTIKEMLMIDGSSEEKADEIATVVVSHLKHAIQTLMWDLDERHIFDVHNKEYPLILLVQKSCECEDLSLA